MEKSNVQFRRVHEVFARLIEERSMILLRFISPRTLLEAPRPRHRNLFSSVPRCLLRILSFDSSKRNAARVRRGASSRTRRNKDNQNSNKIFIRRTNVPTNPLPHLFHWKAKKLPRNIREQIIHAEFSLESLKFLKRSSGEI